MRALLALALCACAGETGVLSVSLTAAPGSTLLDSVQTLRVTITQPMQVFTAERMNGGFELAIELPATGDPAALIVEGLDDQGVLVANGASPAFPIGAIDGTVVIYMAPPNSVAAAPLALDPPRSELAGGTLQYGVIFAGGRLVASTASDSVVIYNAFDHSLVTGMNLPEPRSGMQLAVGVGNVAYMFGGRASDGSLTASMWRFDTTVAPKGMYSDYGMKEGFARADQLMLPIGGERYLMSGSPPAELYGLDGSVVARDVAPLPAAGATVTANDGLSTTIFAGPDGVIRLRTGAFTTLPIVEAARAGASVVAVPGGKVAVLCGSTDGVRIDAASGTAEVFAGVPAAVKTGCAVASTTRHVLVAGGTLASGDIDGSVAVYDAATFALIATPTLVVPRTNALAFALTNGQILIAGGVDAAGAPIATIELFTPAVN